MIDPPVTLVAIVLLGLALLVAKLLGRKRFYAMALSSTLCFLAAECGARSLDTGHPATAEWTESRERQRDYPYVPDTELIYRYPDNPRGYFGDDNEVVGHINGLGYRGEERGPAKPPGVTRLLVLGDSFTLGMGVRDEDTLPAQLEGELRSAGLDAEVLNFGRTASSTRYQIKLLRTFGLQFHPDLVIVVFFLNDIEGPGGVDFVVRPPVLTHLRRVSRFVNALASSIENRLLSRQTLRFYHEGYGDDSPGWKTVRAALLRGRQLAHSHGAEFVVAIYPDLLRLHDYPYVEIHRTVAGFCRDERIPVLDLLEAFRGRTDSELWVHRTDHHPNEVAQQIAAQRLAKFLRQEGSVRGQIYFPHAPAPAASTSTRLK